MRVLRRVVVFDAGDIEAESTFWAGLLGGTVHRDEDWHSIVVEDEWVIDDLEEAGRRAVELGGRQLQAPRKPADNPDGDEMFAVHASPAGHPLCFGVH